MNLLKYYTLKRCEKMFNAIENNSWRIFKVMDIDGTCYQNKKQIVSPKKLFNLIHLCKSPQSLYVSISEFLKPSHNHGFFANQKQVTKEGYYYYPKKGYITADCILLASYFFMDFDCAEDPNVALEDARKVVRYMQNHHIWEKIYKLHLIQFSGKKGYHLLYKSLKPVRTKDPILRIKDIIDDKEDLAVDIIKSLDLKTIDENHMNIMKDPFRVMACPYSIKSNGSIVTPLLLNGFLKKFPVQMTKARESARAMIKKVASGESISPSTKPRAAKPGNKQGAGLTSYSIFNFFDCRVGGLKKTDEKYITVIKKRKDRFKLDQLRKLQEVYNLSDFYVEQIGDHIYSYNTKLLPYERVIKILRAAKADNFMWFMQKRHYPMQVSSTYDGNSKLKNKKEFITILKSDNAQDAKHSKTHSKCLGLEYDNVAGRNSNIGTMRIMVKT